jgi:protein-disulfide isomerase
MRITRKDVLQLAVAVAIGAATAAGLRLYMPVGTLIGTTSVTQAVFADGWAPHMDPANADVTMVLFTDYQCPACRRSNNAMQKALAEDSRVRVIFKDWPIFGKVSEEAARVAIASDIQGIYVKVHDGLMRRKGALDAAALRAVVEAAGGSWPRLADDLSRNRARIDAQLARNSREAYSLGLGGTPGYLIGPLLVRGGLDERGFRKAFREARSARPEERSER